MNLRTADLADPRNQIALTELESLIRKRYPEAVFSVIEGYEPYVLYLESTVDHEDPDEVFGLVIERLLEYQVEARLPVFVLVLTNR